MCSWNSTRPAPTGLPTTSVRIIPSLAIADFPAQRLAPSSTAPRVYTGGRRDGLRSVEVRQYFRADQFDRAHDPLVGDRAHLHQEHHFVDTHIDIRLKLLETVIRIARNYYGHLVHLV